MTPERGGACPPVQTESSACNLPARQLQPWGSPWQLLPPSHLSFLISPCSWAWERHRVLPLFRGRVTSRPHGNHATCHSC